jgi:hypothetical protein
LLIVVSLIFEPTHSIDDCHTCHICVIVMPDYNTGSPSTQSKPIRQNCNKLLLHRTSWQLAHPSAAINEELGVLGWAQHDV